MSPLELPSPTSPKIKADVVRCFRKLVDNVRHGRSRGFVTGVFSVVRDVLVISKKERNKL